MQLERILAQRERLGFMLSLFDRAFRELSMTCGHKPEEIHDEQLSDSKELVPVEVSVTPIEYQELPDDYIDAKALRRLIRQYTHPDKLVRASAKDKVKLINYFAESETEDYKELVFIFCMVVVITNNRNRILPYMPKLVAQYEYEIGYRINELLNKWFAEAAILFGQGKIAEAEKVFKSHLYTDDDCFE